MTQDISQTVGSFLSGLASKAQDLGAQAMDAVRVAQKDSAGQVPSSQLRVFPSVDLNKVIQKGTRFVENAWEGLNESAFRQVLASSSDSVAPIKKVIEAARKAMERNENGLGLPTAEWIYNRALKKYSGSAPFDKIAQVCFHQELGKLYVEQGEPAKAEREFAASADLLAFFPKDGSDWQAVKQCLDDRQASYTQLSQYYRKMHAFRSEQDARLRQSSLVYRAGKALFGSDLPEKPTLAELQESRSAEAALAYGLEALEKSALAYVMLTRSPALALRLGAPASVAVTAQAPTMTAWLMGLSVAIFGANGMHGAAQAFITDTVDNFDPANSLGKKFKEMAKDTLQFGVNVYLSMHAQALATARGIALPLRAFGSSLLLAGAQASEPFIDGAVEGQEIDPHRFHEIIRDRLVDADHLAVGLFGSLGVLGFSRRQPTPLAASPARASLPASAPNRAVPGTALATTAPAVLALPTRVGAHPVLTRIRDSATQAIVTTLAPWIGVETPPASMSAPASVEATAAPQLNDGDDFDSTMSGRMRRAEGNTLEDPAPHYSRGEVTLFFPEFVEDPSSALTWTVLSRTEKEIRVVHPSRGEYIFEVNAAYARQSKLVEKIRRLRPGESVEIVPSVAGASGASGRFPTVDEIPDLSVKNRTPPSDLRPLGKHKQGKFQKVYHHPEIQGWLRKYWQFNITQYDHHLMRVPTPQDALDYFTHYAENYTRIRDFLRANPDISLQVAETSFDRAREGITEQQFVAGITLNQARLLKVDEDDLRKISDDRQRIYAIFPGQSPDLAERKRFYAAFPGLGADMDEDNVIVQVERDASGRLRIKSATLIDW